MRCAIASPVRNVGAYLENVLLNVDALCSIFDDTVVLFYYDKSTDNTWDTLVKYQDRSRHPVFLLGHDDAASSLSSLRTVRIASARNALLQTVEMWFADFDFIVMMDGDDRCSEPIDLNLVRQNLCRNDWDALSFNRPGYYDAWALLYHPFVHNCWGFGNDSLKMISLMRNDITEKLRVLPENELYPCYSAFNGFSIYRLHMFKGCRYYGRPKSYFSQSEMNDLRNFMRQNGIGAMSDPEEMCEHHSFHLDAVRTRQARIRISPHYLFQC